MCLSIPAKVISINGNTALVSTGGAEYQANLDLIDNVKIGDYILLHTGLAIEKLSEEEALETLKVFEDFKELNDLLDQEEKQTGKRIV
ncbi:MAG: HypC/HybG/HupF family hydrogenase formation chaperone [Bacteroidales bacterium]|jgi:hydrogenase expression/formation protein HypC|nr:HypC/HybG/HupF family hydrogenase formation chaperone [Bacteroidales bacterium]MCK9498172.1 HypC/HybG/HupF family hydrogenase formation chaperone [Bacteroidales bacterium]MDY0313491.1 HypC/HybG/HupF family hydrogenase formation chaperone [Bacteroidales bacterium]NLB87503.1 HypC/HybG/HupF family hydrogenase formation chaperone [Bacteroidales bacterium]